MNNRNNRKKKFEEICEAFGVIETKKRTMYPRGIQFSDKFLNALQEEYNRQKISESTKEKPLKARIDAKPQPIAKAIKKKRPGVPISMNKKTMARISQK